MNRARVPAGHLSCAATAAYPNACVLSESSTWMVSMASAPFLPLPFPFPFPLARPFAAGDGRWLLATAAAYRSIV